MVGQIYGFMNKLSHFSLNLVKQLSIRPKNICCLIGSPQTATGRLIRYLA